MSFFSAVSSSRATALPFAIEAAPAGASRAEEFGVAGASAMASGALASALAAKDSSRPACATTPFRVAAADDAVDGAAIDGARREAPGARIRRAGAASSSASCSRRAVWRGSNRALSASDDVLPDRFIDLPPGAPASEVGGAWGVVSKGSNSRRAKRGTEDAARVSPCGATRCARLAAF